MNCPACGDTQTKVIYGGLPMRLCDNEQCNRLDGIFSFVAGMTPFNGAFLPYERSYWLALIRWFFMEVE